MSIQALMTAYLSTHAIGSFIIITAMFAPLVLAYIAGIVYGAIRNARIGKAFLLIASESRKSYIVRIGYPVLVQENK